MTRERPYDPTAAGRVHPDQTWKFAGWDAPSVEIPFYLQAADLLNDEYGEGYLSLEFSAGQKNYVNVRFSGELADGEDLSLFWQKVYELKQEEPGA